MSTTEQACWSASKAAGEHVNLACMWLWNLSACLQSVMKPACTTFSKCVQGCSLTCFDFVDVNKLVCQFVYCGWLRRLHLLPEMQSRAIFVQQSACAMQIQLCMLAAEQPTVSIVDTPLPDLCRIFRRDVESFLTVIIGKTWHFLPSQSLSLYR